MKNEIDEKLFECRHCLRQVKTRFNVKVWCSGTPRAPHHSVLMEEKKEVHKAQNGKEGA